MNKFNPSKAATELLEEQRHNLFCSCGLQTDITPEGFCKQHCKLNFKNCIPGTLANRSLYEAMSLRRVKFDLQEKGTFNYFSEGYEHNEVWHAEAKQAYLDNARVTNVSVKQMWDYLFKEVLFAYSEHIHRKDGEQWPRTPMMEYLIKTYKKQ